MAHPVARVSGCGESRRDAGARSASSTGFVRRFGEGCALANDKEARMRVAILGTGVVGQALGKAFVTLGHETKMGSRDAKNEKAVAWAKEMGPKASTGTFADAAAFAEMVVLA